MHILRSFSLGVSAGVAVVGFMLAIHWLATATEERLGSHNAPKAVDVKPLSVAVEDQPAPLVLQYECRDYKAYLDPKSGDTIIVFAGSATHVIPKKAEANDSRTP